MAISTRTVHIDAHPMTVSCALPEARGRVPALVVIQHAPGVDEPILATVERLAQAGYAAFAPDLYHRIEDRASLQPLERMKRLKDVEVIADVNATIEHLQQDPALDPQRIGIMGFCMGGRVAYMMAGVNARLKAAVVYYGGNIMRPWGEDVPAPFARTRDIHCPLLFHFGEDDTNPSPDDMRALDQELTRFGKAHEFHTYAKAGHAFMNFTSPERYREAAAETSWTRTLEFLRRNVG